jgi:hypothetical protein
VHITPVDRAIALSSMLGNPVAFHTISRNADMSASFA